MKELIEEIEKWSSKYEFSFQFWGHGSNNVFINKGGVELISFGGENSIEDILKLTLKWVNDKNPLTKRFNLLQHWMNWLKNI